VRSTDVKRLAHKREIKTSENGKKVLSKSEGATISLFKIEKKMNIAISRNRTQFLSFIPRTDSPLINDDESGRRASLPNNVLPENFLLRQKPNLPPTLEDEARERVFKK
jgi:hypothetical protein